jgi:hypothetical protein
MTSAPTVNKTRIVYYEKDREKAAADALGDHLVREVRVLEKRETYST